ncbi:hypothetical protein L1049_016597 [Liquidambar formosana]|uniref:RNase H type-1 domain-containing protein n=1 Tax=Liquidambar formosana TaxID=63359 RepID=A0AAP0S116_LIQFO
MVQENSREGDDGLKWMVPSVSRYKVNVDGTRCRSSKNGGVGIVIRKEKGESMAGLAKRYPHLASAEMVEAMAIREGLNFCMDIEGDAQAVVKAVKSYGGRGFEIEVLICDIISLAQSVKVFNFFVVPRVYNRAVNAVVKHTFVVDE